MEELNLVRSWVMGFPGWEGELAVDSTDCIPGSCGLFPVGKEQLNRREDVLGNVRFRYRERFLLRRTAVKGEQAAAWIMAFTAWAESQTPPALGENAAVSVEKGKLLSTAPDGTATYEVTVNFTYEKENEYGKN